MREDRIVAGGKNIQFVEDVWESFVQGEFSYSAKYLCSSLYMIDDRFNNFACTVRDENEDIMYLTKILMRYSTVSISRHYIPSVVYTCFCDVKG